MSEQIVVLGMHRSGTSVVALILKALNVNMGDDTLEAGASNPFGHEEDKDFLDLNKRFLGKARGAWDFPPVKSRLDRVAPRFEEEISCLISSKNKRSTLWGWKEPRTSLLFSYYRSHLDDYKVISVTRDSEMVARSLKKRDRMPLKKGLRLCETYNQSLRESLANIDADKIFRLNFDDLIAHKETLIDALIDFLGVEVSEEQRGAALDVIKPRSTLAERARVTGFEKRIEEIKKAFVHPIKAVRYIVDKGYRFIRYRLKG